MFHNYIVQDNLYKINLVNTKRSNHMKNKLKLIKMSSVDVEEIQWIWYPYIPYGKVTIIQGDPGEGKTTFILALIALLTKGEPLPEEETATEPINVIYQTARMVSEIPSSLAFYPPGLIATEFWSSMKTR